MAAYGSNGVTRIRVVDIPIGKTRGGRNAFVSILAGIEQNILAGIGPQEALEVVPPGTGKYSYSQLLNKLNKLIAEKKYSVDAFAREKEGRKVIYIVGR
jgi:hypothetical protein